MRRTWFVLAGLTLVLLVFLVVTPVRELWLVAPTRRPLPPTPPFAPRERALIFAPHPDDETLATGGVLHLLARQGLPV